jgi:hypothetical protein
MPVSSSIDHKWCRIFREQGLLPEGENVVNWRQEDMYASLKSKAQGPKGKKGGMRRESRV